MGIGGSKNDFGDVVDYTNNNSGFDALRYTIKRARTKDIVTGTGPYLAKVLRVEKVNPDLDIDFLSEAYNNLNSDNNDKAVKPINALDFRNRVAVYARITNDEIITQPPIHCFLPDPPIFGNKEDIDFSFSIDSAIKLHTRFIAISDDLPIPSPGDYIWVNYIDQNLSKGIYTGFFKSGPAGQITSKTTCATQAFKKAVPTGSLSSLSGQVNNPEGINRDRRTVIIASGSVSVVTGSLATPPDNTIGSQVGVTEDDEEDEAFEEDLPNTDPPQKQNTGIPVQGSSQVSPENPKPKRKPGANTNCISDLLQQTSLRQSSNPQNTALSTDSPGWLFRRYSFENVLKPLADQKYFKATRPKYNRGFGNLEHIVMFICHETGGLVGGGKAYASKKVNLEYMDDFFEKQDKYYFPTKKQIKFYKKPYNNKIGLLKIKKKNLGKKESLSKEQLKEDKKKIDIQIAQLTKERDKDTNVVALENSLKQVKDMLGKSISKQWDAMHFFGGPAGEIYQIQSLNTVSHHANQLNNVSVGTEVVNKVFFEYDPLKKYVAAAEKGVFVFGEHTGVEPFLGKNIYNKVLNKFNSLREGKDYRGILSSPLNFKIRTFANEVSFRRAYELWLWLCSDNNPNKDKIHARFRQSKTAACINDVDGHGTGFTRGDLFLVEDDDISDPNNDFYNYQPPKAFVWAKRLSTGWSPSGKKTIGYEPGYPKWRKNLAYQWDTSLWSPAFKRERGGNVIRDENGQRVYLKSTRPIEDLPHWFQGVASHCFFGGKGNHVDGWPILYYFLGRWLGMSSEDAYFAVFGAYATTRIGGKLDEYSDPNLLPLKPGYVYYPNHPGTNYVEIGKAMFRDSPYYENGNYILNPHINLSSSTLKSTGASSPPDEKNGRDAEFPRSVIFKSDKRFTE